MARLKTGLTLGVAIAAAMMLLGGCDQEPIRGRGLGTAVMLLGYQGDYLEANGRLPVAQDQVQPMIDATNAIVTAARANAMLVFYTRDEASPFAFVSNWSRHYATPRLWAGSQLDERADVNAGPVFAKSSKDAFCNSKLEPWLDEQNIGELVIAGAYADRSVLTTARAALARKYKVTVISDALAGTSDASRDAAIKSLKDAGVDVESSQQFVAAIKPSTAIGLRGPLTGSWWLLKH
ncbi:MAG: cysteine hydrolase [Candidatus Binataceae bacterium]|nr:cysteine hydrolase [Candidatus Binataceae bacterium]